MKVLTIDFEDWFHILDHPSTAHPSSWEKMESRIEKNTYRLLELLEEKNQKATWFILGWAAKKYPALLKEISLKHDLGIHSVNHELLFTLTRHQVFEDISTCKKIVEDIAGKKINSYRAPGFSFTGKTTWLIEILSQTGIEIDCSVFPASRNHGGYPDFPERNPCRIRYGDSEVREFPMTAFSFLGKQIVYSGGGYFRLMPYGLINSFIKKSGYAMTYFHPRDFDRDQPVLNDLSLRRKLMSYVGLKNSFLKLKRLLTDHKFVTVNEASRNIDWNSMPLIDLNKSE
jgi:polysaccharide deacetylase family protein (PEP-CTERM system associated)